MFVFLRRRPPLPSHISLIVDREQNNGLHEVMKIHEQCNMPRKGWEGRDGTRGKGKGSVK